MPRLHSVLVASSCASRTHKKFESVSFQHGRLFFFLFCCFLFLFLFYVAFYNVSFFLYRPPAVQQHQDGAAAKSQRYFARPNELCKFHCQFNRWQRLRRRQLAFWCVCVSVFFFFVFFLPYFSLSPRTNNMLEVDDFIWNVGSAAQRVELIARLNAIWKRSKCNSN